jgi:hypothetical protein
MLRAEVLTLLEEEVLLEEEEVLPAASSKAIKLVWMYVSLVAEMTLFPAPVNLSHMKLW